MTAKSNSCITCNCKCSDYNRSITKSILYFKLNSVNTGSKNNVFSSCKILTGNSYVRKCITVNVNLTCSIIKLNVISNNSRECHAVTVDYNTIIQRLGFILCSIAYIAYSRKNSIIYSGAIVKSDIINIEGMHCRSCRLNVSTDKRR